MSVLISNAARLVTLHAIVACCVFSIRADTLRRVPILRSGIISDGVGNANIVLQNVEGPAVPEIISCSGTSAFALTRSAAGYRPSWFSAPVNCAAIAAGDVNADGALDIVVGTAPSTGAGSLLVFSPDRLAPARASVQIPGTRSVADVALGNVDADSALEIVVCTTTDTYVLDAATLTLEWTATGRGGHTVLIGDLEGDGPREIIVTGNAEGHVLDAATQSWKWGYANGFGSSVAIGDVDGDGRDEIVGGSSNKVTIIQGDSLTSSFFNTERLVQAIAVGDGNNDGVLDIVTGDDQWGSIRGFDALGTAQWTVQNPEHGVSGVAVGDPDGDGVNEAVWGAGFTSSGKDSLFVASTMAFTPEWSADDLDGPLRLTSADLDGDGDVELVTSVASTNSGYDGGILQITSLGGVVERTIVLGLGSGFSSRVTRIATGQLDGDPALEIVVLAATNAGGGRLHAYDGVTGALQWSSPSVTSSTSINADGILLVRNVDADSTAEIIISTSDSRVQMLNGASEFVQASTPALDGFISSAAFGDLDGNALQELVVGTDAGFYVLRVADFSQRVHTTLSGRKFVGAMAGEFAIALQTSPYASLAAIISYDGTTLLEKWRCNGAATDVKRLRYLTLGGSQWLAVADAATLRLFAAGVAACPTAAAAEQAIAGLIDFELNDVTGDGAEDLLLSTSSAIEVDLISLSTEARGDADGDGQVIDADLDALGRHFFGDGEGVRATGDANGDSALHPDDLFYLINYRRGTGAPPP